MHNARNSYPRAEQPGYAMLLGLLITVVIGMIIWYARMHGPVYQIGKGKSDIEVPWRQWHDLHVRTQKGHPPGLPGEQQPQISQALHVAARPNEDTQQRGQSVFTILPDGTVEGQWTGQFNISKYVDYQVMGCQFKGLDKLVEGEIILTTDEKNFYLYTWKGKAEQGGASLF